MIKILVAILLSITSVAAQNDWTDKIELINQEKINTEHTEFSPAYWNEYIVFVASRPRAKLFDPNTRDAYYDLYYAAGSEPGTLSKVALLSKNINTPTHEGPISFDPINNSIYYSSLEVDSDNISRNKIFKSDFLNSEWQKGALSELNFDQTAACHPSIDPTGQTIYFASDRPGGFGKMDLYSYSVAR